MTDYNFDLTPLSIEKVHKALKKRNGGALRVGVKGGGCSGYRYVLEFDDKEPRDRDIVFSFFHNDDEVRVYCDQKSILILNGVTLDWQKTLKYQGFAFVNPSKKSSCGCGESFIV